MAGKDVIPPSPSRSDYEDANEPSGTDILDLDEPFDLFERWLADAREKEPNDPNAMGLATADDTGLPDLRMVLLKDFDRSGFVFYTNTESRKGVQLEANAKAALCFHWKSLRRQVRIQGSVSQVSDEEADAYFASRARDSRIGAWASKQSRPLEGRFELEAEIAKYAAKYAVGEVPRPAHWTGYRVAPLRIEFWRDRAFRLHDRKVFSRENEKSSWDVMRLYP